ncbi:MAG: helix-turn-helix domain-containing protein [Eubacteriales bacterium]|nr:helix-turn-helix domain-containing protein [Eubacteriales bacterium]
MAVFRVEKNANYTTMSNYHLRDKQLSLKAKGLLSFCLSLPDTWDYSIMGLVAVCKEGRDCIMSTLRELEEAGYLKRDRSRNADGTLAGADYVIYEYPQATAALPDSEKPALENPTQVSPTLAEPALENPTQTSTNETSTEENKYERKKAVRHQYGEYRNVLLSDEELSKLQAEFPHDWQARIDRLSEYMASTGKTYKSHLITIRSWARREKSAAKPAAYSHESYYNYDKEDSL